MASNLLRQTDAAYPLLLSQTPNPPAQLYYQGDLAVLQRPCITVVGSRSMTSYGEKMIRFFIPGLVQAGLTVVSGLAYGVDSYAHKVALKAQGLCVAVLGSGLERVYPPGHLPLMQDIVKRGGCVLSEYSPETTVQKHHFPVRNRIVAGLSQVTLVIEAAEKSGTLITARYARDMGRDVCIIPGDITSEKSCGPLSLLKEGAFPVTSVAEVLSFFQGLPTRIIPSVLRPALTGSVGTLYDLISHGVESIDALLEESGLKVAELQSILSVLELDGYIYTKGDRWLKT